MSLVWKSKMFGVNKTIITNIYAHQQYTQKRNYHFIWFNFKIYYISSVVKNKANQFSFGMDK